MLDIILFLVLLVFAFLVWIILSISEKRTKKFESACNSRPGIVFPINFLNPRHRLVYALACAAQASLWLNLLFISWQVDIGANKWIGFPLKALILVLFSIVVVLLTFPMLACVEAPIPILGYGLGLIYSILYLIISVVRIFSALADASSGADQSIKAFIYGRAIGELLPEILSLIGVIIWYFHKLIKESRRIIQCGEYWKIAMLEQPPSMNHINYVKHLFLDKSAVVLGRVSHYYSKVHLPLPMMIATAVSAVTVFQLTFNTVVTFPYIFTSYASSFRHAGEANKNFSYIFNPLSDIFDGLIAVLVIAPLLSTILSVVLFVHLLYTVRKETLLMRRGQSKLCEDVKSIRWSALKLTSSVRYCGFQIASVITGWMFYSIIFFFVGAFFIAVHFLPDIFGYLLYLAFVAGLMVAVPLIIQGLMCKFLFLTSESNKENTIVIDNRRAFNSFTYIVLLYNVATGLYTSTVRLVAAFLLTLLVKPRLDRAVFISPFQVFDSGHSMYKSFMVTEALLHNPVVHVFVQLISERSQKKKSSLKVYESEYRVSQRAKNRWFVAVTLMNNRSLQKAKEEFIEEAITFD